MFTNDRGYGFGLLFSSVQSLSRVQLFVTPSITACQASLSITNSRSSLRLMSIESVMPSKPSHPLLSPSLPAPNPSKHQSLFQCQVGLLRQTRWLRQLRICLQCGRTGFHPWVGEISWRIACNPFQYSCLKNPHGSGSLAGYSPWGHKESDITGQLKAYIATHSQDNIETDKINSVLV